MKKTLQKNPRLFVLVIVVGVIIGFAADPLYQSLFNKNIRTIQCWDPPDIRTKLHGEPVLCTQDSDCDFSDPTAVKRMNAFCSSNGGALECEFSKRDFCGSDGICKQECESPR